MATYKPNSLHDFVLRELELKEDLQSQIDFWSPVIRHSTTIQKYIDEADYYHLYNQYTLQHDIGITKFYDFVFSRLVNHSELFSTLESTTQNMIKILINRRLQ